MDSPDPSLAAWTERLAPVAVPVLRATRDQILHWSQRPDDADAHVLADLVLRDPLMCLRVLVNVSQKLGERLLTPVETVTAALVLTGIEPFFRDFQDLPVLEDRLADQPQALAGALALVERSHRAARLAASFAIHRQDEDVELLHQAALLHDFGHLLLWCEAPPLALEMAARQRQDPNLRSAAVQRDVLGVELEPLAVALMERWGLPPALRELAQPGTAATAGPRTVRLAVQLARHLESGWHNAALPDDFAEIGNLLNLPANAAASLARQAL
jgi:HD-like signal output (HDOD) protein